MKKLFTKCCLLAIAMVMGGVISAYAENWSIDYKSIYSTSIKADKTGVTLTDDGTISGYSAASANEIDLSDGKFYIANGKSWLMRPGGLYSFNGSGTNVALKGCTKNQTITLVYTGATINSVSNTTTVSAGVYKVSADGDVIINVARYGYFEKITIEDPTSDDFDYVVKNSFGDIIANGTSNPTKDPVSVKWSKYIQKDGKWYETTAPYGMSITSATTKTVTYTESNIDYFVECENMSKSRSAAATLNGTGYSYGAAPRHYSNSYWWTSAFAEGGKFTLYIPYQNNNSSGTRISIYTRDASGNLKDTGLYMDGVTGSNSFTVENIMIEPGSSLVLYNTNGYNSNLYMDYLTLTKTGDYTITKTLGTTGFGTFAAACNVTVPEGVTVYTSIFADETITATADETIKVIPANTGVIFKAAAGAEVTFVATADAASSVETALTPAVNGVEGDSSTIFGLLKSENTFAKVMTGVTLANNSAYLKISASSGKGAINFVVDEDNTTAVAGVAEAKAEAKVVKFMKNGQLLIQTANGIINAAAAQVK